MALFWKDLRQERYFCKDDPLPLRHPYEIILIVRKPSLLTSTTSVSADARDANAAANFSPASRPCFPWPLPDADRVDPSGGEESSTYKWNRQDTQGKDPLILWRRERRPEKRPLVRLENVPVRPKKSMTGR